ncbi:hypothetical protein GCM10010358_70210 [Streptomyces minutiscleroticus]|uniref:Uncharacterized protein n=1 Tax=Streptomyces minutiscleroticus TaxID=68238 RepID=A0A918NYY1_9ACTN|nr:hypothetical protein [Streptomyces minutiscleroticus]GGY06909.1 hypothetical protein GCM10010358_70210 [Streptomyces minutiscleroticus]
MRWLILYARSRQVPASAAAVALVTLVAWAFNQDGAGPMNLGIAVLILTANVAAASVGLGGRDVALDRTAAIRWVPRRAAHVLLAGAVAGAALLAVQAAGAELAPAALVVRDSAGLAGLAALGAVLGGAPFAWTLPIGWLSFTLLVPVPPGIAGEVSGWMIIYPATTASAATAWALLATGTVLYAAAGPRR